MTYDAQPVVDFQGRVMFLCPGCGGPITHADLFELGLRTPDQGETADDYRAAELIDSIEHNDCLRAARSA